MTTRAPRSDSDADLVARTLAGDHGAFEILVRRYQAPLYRYALGMLSEPDLAVDVVQGALIRAYTRLSACRDPDRFDSWIFRIVRNGALDRMRSSRRREVPLDDVVTFADDRDDPESRLANAEINREVSAALEQLTPIHREAFLLKHVEGLSYEEISDRLDVSISALKMRVKRAREELQESLRDLAPADV